MSAHRSAAKARRLNDALRRKGWKLASMDPQQMLDRKLLQMNPPVAKDAIMGFPYGRPVP